MEGRRFSGKRLRRMRERELMTQEALAHAIDTEQWIISGYERGKHKPGPNTVNKLTVALRCEEADLYE